MNTIKEYYDIYQEKYKKGPYDRSVLFLKEFETFLIDKLKDNPEDIDAVNMLASVKFELRNDSEVSINLLEDFYNKYKDSLQDKEIARIATNIAYYYEGEEIDKINKWLDLAIDLKSPYWQTYSAKGIYNIFENLKYNLYSLTLDPKKEFLEGQSHYKACLKYFIKAVELNDTYSNRYNYGCCLYMAGDFEKACNLFKELLDKYPERMRLKLNIAYTYCVMGDREKALQYIGGVSKNEDKNYIYSKTGNYSDDIAEYEIGDLYFRLDEYEKSINAYDDINLYAMDVTSYDYFYCLWKLGRYEIYEDLVKKVIMDLEDDIREASTDNEFDTEEEKREYIASCKKDIEDFKILDYKIKNENFKPNVLLQIVPIYECGLVDCIRHNCP